MAQTWLPGDTRQRIQDLIKDSSITQAELAGIIGLSESALSRYLKGQTEMLGDGYIIKIAKHFNVSTDFLLGETDIPDRKNYDIEELGLSAEAAKLLYTAPEKSCHRFKPHLASGTSILSLDAPPPGFDSEANVTYADILPDDYSKNPEQLFIRIETITEVRNALWRNLRS